MGNLCIVWIHVRKIVVPQYSLDCPHLNRIKVEKNRVIQIDIINLENKITWISPKISRGTKMTLDIHLTAKSSYIALVSFWYHFSCIFIYFFDVNSPPARWYNKRGFWVPIQNWQDPDASGIIHCLPVWMYQNLGQEEESMWGIAVECFKYFVEYMLDPILPQLKMEHIKACAGILIPQI